MPSPYVNPVRVNLCSLIAFKVEFIPAEPKSNKWLFARLTIPTPVFLCNKDFKRRQDRIKDIKKL